MKKVKLIEGEYEFDTVGMVFPVSKALYYTLVFLYGMFKELLKK